jgi:hypothetical protein
MLTKLVLTLTAGTILMGSSRAITPPVFVHCVASDAQMERKVCAELVRNLRALKLNRAIAQPPKQSSKTGAGVHVTLHVIDHGNATFQSYLSWRNSDKPGSGEQGKGPVIEVTAKQLSNNIEGLVDALIAGTDLPL